MPPILRSVIALIISGFFGINYPVAGPSASEEQFGISQRKTGDLPLGERHTCPKLSQSAPKNRASFRSEAAPSDSSSYWLFDARFIFYGNDLSDEKKSHCWAFKWMNDTKGPPAIHIVASMDGEPMGIPSI